MTPDPSDLLRRLLVALDDCADAHTRDCSTNYETRPLQGCDCGVIDLLREARAHVAESGPSPTV